MRIIVINLARAAERRAAMTARLSDLGLPFEILDATDGRALSDAERALVDHRARRRITPYPLSDNEIGCWLSHRRALASVIEGSDPMALVLEDDTAFLPGFRAVIEAIERHETNFDFIFLHRKFAKRERFAPCRPLLPGFAIGRVGYTHMCLHAYVVSAAGARRFLAQGPRIGGHAVDKHIHRYWANGLDIYGLEQPVAEQADGGLSYIEETRAQDRPAARPRYDDADHPWWRWRRFVTKTADSVRKRLAFGPYVRRGRA